MDLLLEGKRAIVTGGSRGIGKAIARQLAREGCDVALGARTEGTLKEAAAELSKETGRKIVPLTLDTMSVDSIKAFVKSAADALGGVEIVVNSAARVGGAQGDIETLDEQEILHDFEEKAIGYLRVAREAIPHMKTAGWGRIINISGSAGRSPGTNLSGGARNAAVIVLNKAWANALGKYNITVNAIYPGLTVTERTYDNLAEQAKAENKTVEELKQALDDRTLLKHATTAEDIAYFAAFLASPLAIGMTGEAIAVSGGQSTDVHY
ncbi:MAG TPA: SDR family oxidoreductase [Dehalococcoidia bacterium]|nr:SDR family oxidoreductase [Dehalococcoidia bacterium]